MNAGLTADACRICKLRQCPVESGWVWDQVSDLDYAHAAHVLRLPVSWLKDKAPKGEIPSTGYGKHVHFTPQDIADIRRMHRRNAPIVPEQITANAEYRARVRAALDASGAVSAA